MILILLASILAAAADPDYYAVHIQGDGGRYKMFTKISKCKEAVYHSGDNRVLFQDGVWKIGTLKNDQIDCKKLSSVVDETFRTKEIQMPKHELWIDIKKSEQNWIFNNRVVISIEGLNKCVEKKKLKLVGARKIDAKSKEDCFRKNWRKKDKDIVVAFQDSNCSYSFVDEAELEYDSEATIFVHHSGKLFEKTNM